MTDLLTSTYIFTFEKPTQWRMKGREVGGWRGGILRTALGTTTITYYIDRMGGQ